LFTSFMTGQSKYGNRLISKYRAYKSGAITGREYYRHLLYETAFYGWGELLLSTLYFTGGDVPELWEMALAPFETLTSWIPLARDITGAIKYRKSVGKTPAVEGVDRALKAITSVGKASSGEKEWSAALWDLGLATEFQLGVPALRLYKDGLRNYDKIMGENKGKR